MNAIKKHTLVLNGLSECKNRSIIYSTLPVDSANEVASRILPDENRFVPTEARTLPTGCCCDISTTSTPLLSASFSSALLCVTAMEIPRKGICPQHLAKQQELAILCLVKRMNLKIAFRD